MTQLDTAHRASAPELPPLPHERQTEHFSAGQNLLFLAEGKLINGEVTGVIDYSADIRKPAPGFLHIFSREQAERTSRLTPELIIDINRSEVLTPETLQAIRSDADYREAYLASGPAENQRLKSELETAINQYIAEGRAKGDQPGQAPRSKSKRARLKSVSRQGARLTAWQEGEIPMPIEEEVF